MHTCLDNIYVQNKAKKNQKLIIIISLFAHCETMIVSVEHSKTHSKYKYNTYIQK